MKKLILGSLIGLFALHNASYARGGGGFHMSSRSYSSPRLSIPSSRTYTPRNYTSPGEHYTSGYTRKDGTPVQSYHATNPNSTKMDNWSTRGNVNPYTGQVGTKNPY